MKLASAVAIMTLVLTPAHAVEPFGAATTPSQSAGLITLWLDLQTELAKDEVEIAHCRIDANCGSAAAQRFIAIIDEARRYSGRPMIGHLNRGINGAIQSTRGIVPWLPPLAALSQPGDCKSYAIVKYLALGELGIAASDRRLVMLRGVSRPSEIQLFLVRDKYTWWSWFETMTAGSSSITERSPLWTVSQPTNTSLCSNSMRMVYGISDREWKAVSNHLRYVRKQTFRSGKIEADA
jgi:predicted transglutaminase-like cysteine proteinase